MSIELLIKNGTILDGTGSKAFKADIALEKGRIVEIGRIETNNVEKIDADIVNGPNFWFWAFLYFDKPDQIYEKV